MLDKVDEMIIGGGMAFTFLKVLKNMEVRDADGKWSLGVYILMYAHKNFSGSNKEQFT